MQDLICVRKDPSRAETSRPDPAKVLSGDPVHTTWPVDERPDGRGGLYAGLWHSTPGKWQVSYGEWEYVHILEGHSVLTDATGAATHLWAGDSWIIRPGFSGSWEVLDATLKEYVIIA